jgi:hypothetical protein
MRGTTGQFRETHLQEFGDWFAAHITGDEKGQAQIFLDRLFRAFGQKGSLGQPVTAPGVPPSYRDAKKLITEDCIRPMRHSDGN